MIRKLRLDVTELNGQEAVFSVTGIRADASEVILATKIGLGEGDSLVIGESMLEADQ